MENTTEYQSQILCNRVSKRFKHLKKWAKRCNISSFRIYDKDIPEIPLAIDFYEGVHLSSEKMNFPEKFLVFYLYERPYQKDENEEFSWFQTMAFSVASLLGIDNNNIFLKNRKKQKGLNQYEKIDSSPCKIIVEEQNCKFIVNLSEYLDTGLFFDHRPLRKLVSETCENKNVLNLFCYTSSFSLYSAKGNAKSITSVDLSNTYINWSKQNFKINGFNPDDKKFRFVNSDVIAFLKSEKNKYDIIILDPPTFSNSKKTENNLDINRDCQNLIELCCKLLNPNGILYFSTNSKKLNLKQEMLPQNYIFDDITDFSIPEDYRNKKIHKCWKIYYKI